MKIFPPFFRLFLHFSCGVLYCTEILSFIRSHLSTAILSVCAPVILFRMSLPGQISSSIFSTFSFMRLSVSGCTLRSLVYLELIFVLGLWAFIGPNEILLS